MCNSFNYKLNKLLLKNEKNNFVSDCIKTNRSHKI